MGGRNSLQVYRYEFQIFYYNDTRSLQPDDIMNSAALVSLRDKSSPQPDDIMSSAALVSLHGNKSNDSLTPMHSWTNHEQNGEYWLTAFSNRSDSIDDGQASQYTAAMAFMENILLSAFFLQFDYLIIIN
ncbi:NAC domain containing protein 4 [Striga asiatica]|uniref:NAC domain containing protein 4 n=1 Tax=Striga asiatica TaxID=4170 RepID=A0A5A7P0J5_STRAF|nr:NAC domain containing protein 4 [Striga asiatica]